MSDLKIPEGYTPGPWRWFGGPSHSFYLATIDRGRQYVMGFRRMGMQSAQPIFRGPRGQGMLLASELCIFEVCREATSKDDPRVYRDDIIGFRNADAELLAIAPEMADEIARLRAQLAAIAEDGTAEHNAAVALRQELANARQEAARLREGADKIDALTAEAAELRLQAISDGCHVQAALEEAARLREQVAVLRQAAANAHREHVQYRLNGSYEQMQAEWRAMDALGDAVVATAPEAAP